MENYPYGKVIEYRITDGVEIGLIIKLNNGESFWFFSSGIKSGDFDLVAKDSFSITDNNNKLNINYSNKLEDVLNPINFINWLRLSLNDVL